MKKIHPLFSLLVLLLLQLHSFAQYDNEGKKKYEFAKSRAVNKSYNVSPADKLNISNSFGSVDLHTWTKNEIKVDVVIEVSANTEAFAQKIFDGIDVSENQKGNEISFKTSIKGSNNSKNDKSNMSVNYSIYMPASNPLRISNEFGATTLPDYNGQVDLISKFGSLTTGSLPDTKSISVEFGKAELGSVSNGTVTVKYSKASIGKLSGNVKLNFEFCGSAKVGIDNSLTGLDLRASYSVINLRPTGSLPAAYHITTSFGSFKNTTAIKFDSDEKDDNKGPKFDFIYEGKSGNGTIPVKASTSFGKIILGEASQADMDDKDKSHSKGKKIADI